MLRDARRDARRRVIVPSSSRKDQSLSSSVFLKDLMVNQKLTFFGFHCQCCSFSSCSSCESVATWQVFCGLPSVLLPEEDEHLAVKEEKAFKNLNFLNKLTFQNTYMNQIDQKVDVGRVWPTQLPSCQQLM